MQIETNSIGVKGGYQVLLFYKYFIVKDPIKMANEFRRRAARLSLTGRVIVAEEGINGTLEGTAEKVEEFTKYFLSDERFSDVQVKRSESAGNSFPSLSVKVRKEIVGTGFSEEEANPQVMTAEKISPEELRAWYESDRDFVVVDMRNNYEFVSGHFKNAIDPDISASRHLPLALKKLESVKDKTVVAVCTGGIRCEKMSAYLINKGFKNVRQLEGGIHSYIEKYPGKDFLGTLYTFDQRVTMHFGGERTIIGKCRLCGASTERYADCAEQTCHIHFLACDNCRDVEGNAFCGEECKIASIIGG